jgi:hypothetical protein
VINGLLVQEQSVDGEGESSSDLLFGTDVKSSIIFPLGRMRNECVLSYDEETDSWLWLLAEDTAALCDLSSSLPG